MNDGTSPLPIPAQRADSDSVERWLPVVGYEGIYQVSDRGRVRGIRRRGSRGSALSASVNGGYLRVFLARGDGQRGKKQYVHILVVQSFVGPRPLGLAVRHLDGDRFNNVPSNLAYGTHSENNLDLVRHGRHINARKTHCPRGHEYSPENTYQRPDRNERECRRCKVERIRRRRTRAMAD